MQLIAVGGALDLEEMVDPRSIDQLHRGQTAMIRFPSFNQRTTPEVFGQLDEISASSVVDGKTGVAFYRADIRVPQAELSKLGKLTLVPGMPAEAFIQTSPRTVLSFIMKPLQNSVVHVFREE